MRSPNVMRTALGHGVLGGEHGVLGGVYGASGGQVGGLHRRAALRSRQAETQGMFNVVHKVGVCWTCQGCDNFDCLVDVDVFAFGCDELGHLVAVLGAQSL